MLQIETIEPHTLLVLSKLSGLSELRCCRLVGGTALALQYGHRKSIDLDFFGTIDCDDDVLMKALKSVGTFKEIFPWSKNIKICSIDGIKIDIVNYSYGWIDSALNEDDITLASPKDIAAMKINAIEGRGSKKDFIDVYFLLQHYSLEELLKFYSLKYPDYSMFRAIQSLGYFEDAEPQPMPKMFIEVDWNEIKHFISETIANY